MDSWLALAARSGRMSDSVPLHNPPPFPVFVLLAPGSSTSPPSEHSQASLTPSRNHHVQGRREREREREREIELARGEMCRAGRSRKPLRIKVLLGPF
ncbi:hypothetical protein GQ53DRAFT_226005 [Thozetella sp. PMI_491]|nr:hypothetical protein GQ53DRAFT_226005 [Thozetella sp. PMI_491]